MSELMDWARKEVELARIGNEDRVGFSNYVNLCYDSALKALESLCDDWHSGLSITVTKSILNRMIDHKPLTPITEENAEWKTINIGDKETHYQSGRMWSLFKHVAEDGTVRYTDSDRIACIDIFDPATMHKFGVIDNIVNKMYPIEMPYMPSSDAIVVRCEYLLTDEKNGDFDTVGVYSLEHPEHEAPIPINRYFKSDEYDFDWVEITSGEFYDRKLKAHKLLNEDTDEERINDKD